MILTNYLIFFFKSNIIEENNRDIKFIWDGFILFTDKYTTIEAIKIGEGLHDSRLVALQRTSVKGQKANREEVKNYILAKLSERNIPYEIMSDKKEVTGYPSKTDLWSTRDNLVLIDAIDTVGDGIAYFFRNSSFKYKIAFNKSKIPLFFYNHSGAIVLKGQKETAISRFLLNDTNLIKIIEEEQKEKVYSTREGKYLTGTEISKLKEKVKQLKIHNQISD